MLGLMGAQSEIDGEKFYSSEIPATVEYPSNSRILSDAGVTAAMNTEWANTLAIVRLHSVENGVS